MTLAAIEESRLSGGTLTLDGDDFAKQHTDVSLVPSVESGGDRVEVLSGQFLAPDETYTWTLNLGFIQDFNDAEGIVNTLRTKAGQVVPFAWQPNDIMTAPLEGTVRLRPTTIGGTVATRLTGTVELPVVTLDD